MCTMKFVSLLIVLLVNSKVSHGEKEEPRLIVSTPLGQIEGHVGWTVNSIPFYRFDGIPYAKPPIGDLRFEDPQDPQPWTGVWKANVLTKCMQIDHGTQDLEKKYVIHGDEDCLHINVYTHSLSQTENLDVLVHIHGGAFMFGQGSHYGPEIIMDRNIVFVNLNYRVGPLGFLSTEDDVLPGNLGLKDQVHALKWIKKNIHFFGGNPNSITIHGLSAGGASVHFHYLIPASTGLFNRGISQSGSTLDPWVLMENAREKTYKVADLVGCPTGSSEEVLKCLKSKPARHIVQSVREFQPWLYNPFSPFGAVADGQWSKNPVLPDHPYNLLKQGKVQDLPWIISYTSAEGLYPVADFYADDKYLSDIDTKWNEIMPFVLHYNDSVEFSRRDEVSQKVRKQYFENQSVNRKTYPILVDVVSDRLFVADIVKSAILHSAAVKSPIYSYYYNYRATTSLSDLTSASTDDIGVCHGDDTMLILKMPYPFPKYELTSESDKKMSKLIIDLTISFMKNGSPNVTNTWTPLSKNPTDPFKTLKINNFEDLELISIKNAGQAEFWDSLPLKENEKLISVKDEL